MEYHKISSQILRDHQDDLMWEYQGSEGWSGGYMVTTYSGLGHTGHTVLHNLYRDGTFPHIKTEQLSALLSW